ncbi:cadherin-like beta sandwich domain-containing protein, partial [Clostridium tetanomorphum]
ITKLTTVNAGLNWSGDVAHWNTVPNAISYDVQLYKDGNPLNSSVNVLVANAAAGVDFSSAIAVGGSGTYTYKVTARADSSTLFLDGDQSAASGSNIKAIQIQLAQVTNVALSSTGVATWDNVANETNFQVQLYKDGNPQGTPVIKAADAVNHDFLVDMRSAGPGIYTVKVTAKGNGSTYTDGPQSEISNSQTIVKLLAVTDGLNWNEDVAYWTAVANAVSYDVQLYKDGNQLNIPVNVLAANVASGVDFSPNIAAGGSGIYTYKVTAKGNGVLMLDAIQSIVSNENIKTSSNDSALSGLSISSGAFNESFAPEITSYTATVANGVTSITVTPIVNESHAMVKVAGKAVVNGHPSDDIPLNVGINPISVVVIAKDGTTKTYVITVTRLAMPSTPISNLKATAGDGKVTLNFDAPTGATNVVMEQSIDGVNYTAAKTSVITVATTSAEVMNLKNGQKYSFRLLVTGGLRAGMSNVATATPIAANSGKSSNGGSNTADKVNDIIRDIVKIEVNGKITNTNEINQEKIVEEVKSIIKQSLEDIEVKALEKDLNSSEGAVQIKVNRMLTDIETEINNIVNKNLGNEVVSKNSILKYEVKMSVIEEATNKKVYEKLGLKVAEEEIKVEDLKDFTSYIVKFDIVVDGKVVGTRETKITTLDRTPPVVHDLEINNGILKVNATDNFKLNDKPYMLIVSE